MTDFKTDVSFHLDVRVLFSTARDGSMASGGGQVDDSTQYAVNVDRFLARHGIDTGRVRLFVTYGADRTYTDVARVSSDDHGQEVTADALYTTDANCTMTLPVADCVATVVYDPVTNMTGLLHLGRHASVAGLIESFTIDVADALGSDPRDWYVWMSPSIRAEHDRLDYFDSKDTEEWREFVDEKSDGVYIDTIGHNRTRFMRAGVDPDRITVLPHDTYTDTQFYSHRAAIEQNEPLRQGRMACFVTRRASSN